MPLSREQRHQEQLGRTFDEFEAREGARTHMQVCVCLCVCVCLWVCVYVCVYVCVHF
jgi:hypothetical protein